MEECWQRFVQSGSVMDYLDYKRKEQEEKNVLTKINLARREVAADESTGSAYWDGDIFST